MSAEVNFPRGGKKPRSQKFDERLTSEQDEDLFKIIKEIKTDKKPSKKSKKKKAGFLRGDNEEVVSVENLSRKTILSDLLVLGCLRDIGDYGLSVSLPGGITARVPLTNISDSYTDLLQKYSHNPEEMQEEIATLSSLYQIGRCFPMRVISHVDDPATNKSLTTLSMNPKSINRDISSASVFHRMLLSATVSSVEDHGFIMDIGINNLKGFLKSSEGQRYHGSTLHVGQVLACSVDMPEESSESILSQRVLRLTAKPKSFEKPLDLDEIQISLHSLLPGTQVKGIIMEVKRNGLVLKCGQYSSCVFKDHLQGVFDHPTKYKIGQEVQGTVLYLHPISNIIHLTLAPRLTPKSIKSLFDGLKYGDIVDNASIMDVAKSKVYFHISDKVKGLSKLNHLSERDVNMDSAADNFHVGEKKKCRILGFNYLDRVLLVSLRNDVLHQNRIDKDDIQVGRVFHATVDHVVEKGVVLKLGQGSFGFVPNLHVTDKETTKPAKFLPVGQKVQCRVLRVDHLGLGNYVKPLLTCKRSLVSSPLQPLASFEQAEVDAQYHGVVVQANASGIVLAFYNDVTAWVPVRELSTEYIEYPEKVFYIGQVVKARVTRTSPEDKRIFMSLRIDTKKPFGLKSMADGNTLNPGEVVSVKVTGKKPNGLDLEVLPSGLKAFLPVNHLSDHPRLCKLFLQLYAIGDVLKDCICFSTKGNIIISRKKILCDAAKSGTFIFSIEYIQPGQLIPGVIKAFMSYGIFVEIGSGICGLVHKKHLVDGRANDPSTSGYVTHQSVVCRVLEVHPNSRRLVLSTSISDVLSDSSNEEDSSGWLENYLQDWKELSLLNVQKENFHALAVLKVSSVVSVTVTSVNEEGILCRTSDGVAGIITNQNIGESNPVVDETYEAVVLHKDLKNNCAELSICPWLVKTCKKTPNGKKLKMDHILGKDVAGTILLIRSHFALAALHKPGEGALVYLPVLKHPNDLLGIAYTTGDTVPITIHKICKKFLIGTKSKTEKPSLKRRSTSEIQKTTSKLRKDTGDGNQNVLKDKNKAESQKSSQTPLTEFGISVGDTVEGTVTNFSKKKTYLELKKDVFGSLSRRPTAERPAFGSIILVRVVNITDSHFHLAPAKADAVNGNTLSSNVGLGEQTAPLAKRSRYFDNDEDEISFNHKAKKMDSLNNSKATLKESPSKKRKPGREEISDVLLSEHKEVRKAPEVSGTVTNFNDHEVYVKLPSGERGSLNRRKLRKELDHDLAVGSEVLVNIIIRKKNSEATRLRFVRVVQEPSQRNVLPINPVFVPQFRKDSPNETSEESENEELQEKETVGCVGLSSHRVPVTSSTNELGEKRLQVSGGLQWDVEATPNLSNLEQKSLVAVHSDSSDGESDVDDKKSKSNAKKKRNKRKEEEDFLIKQEQRLMDYSREPETVDDFDRLVLSQPDNSVVWLKYMSFHLQQAEVDKARAVAQKALSTISFREEQEKLNIWFALINLENLYGTNESLETTFQKAVQLNDPLKVYTHLANVYAQNGKNQEAEKLYTVMLKKFKGQPQPWLDFASHCLTSGKSQKAHDLFQQCLQSLEKRHHVEVVVKFAQMEFKVGEMERGKTMMESLLASYPKRTDLWSQYADLLLKRGDIQGTRQVLERSVSTNLPAKKMKFLFKKYLDFEKQHGTEKLIDDLKQKALDFVQSTAEVT